MYTEYVMDTTTQRSATSDYLRGWREGFTEGYEVAARGHMAANLVLVMLPDQKDPSLHDRIRERIHEVLRDEGLSEAPVVDIVS